MTSKFGFVRATPIGGIVFLVPLVVILASLGKAFELMTKVAGPLADWLPIFTAADIIAVNLLAAALVLLVWFIAGLLARTVFARRRVRNLESRFLDHIAAYAFVKGPTTSLAAIPLPCCSPRQLQNECRGRNRGRSDQVIRRAPRIVCAGILTPSSSPSSLESWIDLMFSTGKTLSLPSP
jgi:hypothetical protein